ncbi:MAG TPA: hydrogenase iron-sulfur subunit [Caldisericia bacterium]|nr:hydrogenase iron-sulfur subunit [Caldisericia bacterium]HPF49357.1 hydrogenase iron-sulfur subunit [Caldisericia bacterium]HPI84433.1 hydrogenase iron-sulfur subunit [Caldisericia bacterium]HPQ93806.1 hydrogenase iron-sulfur subunit [Caldisericia bacterium]HRV75630.1 hydrogenase iron-sulfur subunit [Caldisericia bacterium]
MADTKRRVFNPKIVTYVCNWCSSASGDLVGPIRTPYKGIPRIMRVLCTGRIQADDILATLEMGADGVLIAGCEFLECNYRTGNMIAKKRVRFAKNLLSMAGFSPERIDISLGFLQLIRNPVDEFRKKILKLGPLGQAPTEGLTPEQVRLNLATARKVTQDPQVGWLVGKEPMLTEKTNTYGDTLSEKEFDEMIASTITEKYKIHTVLSKIEKVPMTIPQIAVEADLPSNKVFTIIQDLQRDGFVTEEGKSGRYYQYIQA